MSRELDTAGLRKRSAIVKHVALLLLSVGMVAGLCALTGFDRLHELGDVNGWFIAVSALATLGLLGANALRWFFILRMFCELGASSFGLLFHYLVISRVLGYIIPKDLSDLGLRTLMASKRGVIPLAAAGISVLLDRLADLIVSGLLLVPSLLFWFGLLSKAWACSLGVACVGVMLAVCTLRRGQVVRTDGIGRYLEKLPWLRKVVWPSQGVPVGVLGTILGCSLVKVGFTVLRLRVLAWALSLELDSALFLLTISLAQLSFMLAFTPGGLGVMEISWTALLVLAGCPEQDAVKFALGLRALTLIHILLIGLASQAMFLAFRFRTQRAACRTENEGDTGMRR